MRQSPKLHHATVSVHPQYTAHSTGLGLLCAVVWSAAGALALFPVWTLDDAYILLRYAENLALVGELSWNIGDAPVEGYTGIVFPYLVGLAIRVGLPALATAKGIGASAFFTAGLLLYVTARRLGVRPTLGVLAAAMYLLAPIALASALSGMETCLFAAAILLAIYALVWSLERGPVWRDGLLSLCLLFVGLVRPEGLLLAVAALVAVGFVRARTGTVPAMSFLAQVGLLLVLPGTLYMTWRLSTYGTWLPNSFHAKVLDSWISAGSAREMASFVALYLALPVGAALTLALARPQELRRRFLAGPSHPLGVRTSIVCGVGLLFVLGVGFVYLGCHLAMNVAHRFFVPFLPLLLLMAALAWEHGLTRLPAQMSTRRRRLVIAALCAIAVVYVAVQTHEHRVHRAFAADYGALLHDAHRPAAELVRSLAAPGDRLAVVADSGLIPYATGLWTLDMGMLNDPYLARSNPTDEEIVEYFYRAEPDIVVFTSRRWDHVDPPDPRAGGIVADPRFDGYEVVGMYGTTAPRFVSYYEIVLVRVRASEAF